MLYCQKQHRSIQTVMFVLSVAWTTMSLGNAGSCTGRKSTCFYNFRSWRILCNGTSIVRIPIPDKIVSPAPPQTGKILWANGTCIERIYPQDLAPYPRLQEVNLNGNQIRYVENNAFKYCTTVHNISLANNEIQTIHQHAFAGLPNLTLIDLNDNVITEITQFAFNDLGSLRELRLANNRISVIHPDAFRSLRSVEILDLSGNQLTSLPWNGDFKFPSLRTLLLKDNRLTSFDGMDLHYYPKLNKLDLRQNNINTINNTQKFRERQFKYVLLANNQLTYPDPDLFRTSSHSGSLPSFSSEYFVNGNPWSCDCVYEYWYFLKNGITSPQWKTTLDIQCQTGNAAGKMLSTLSLPIFCPKEQPTSTKPSPATSKASISTPAVVIAAPEKKDSIPKEDVEPKKEETLPPENVNPLATYPIKSTTEQVTEPVEQPSPKAFGTEDEFKISVLLVLIVAFVVASIVVIVVIAVFVSRRKRKNKLKEKQPQKETPRIQKKEDKIPAGSANTNLPLLSDPESQTEPKAVVTTTSTQLVLNDPPQVITKDLNGVHYKTPQARSPKIARHRSDSAYHSVGEGQIAYCEDDGETPLKLPIQVQTVREVDTQSITTDKNSAMEIQEHSITVV